jgi:PhnB protein
MQVNPYLVFDGQCATAFRFYAQVLGGQPEATMTFGEMPGMTEMPPEARDRILHTRLRVADQWLMGSDCPPGQYQQPQGMSVALQVDEPAAARRIFGALAAEGAVTMPFEPTFFAAGGFGMLVDRFGIPWMINCERAA